MTVGMIPQRVDRTQHGAQFVADLVKLCDRHGVWLADRSDDPLICAIPREDAPDLAAWINTRDYPRTAVIGRQDATTTAKPNREVVSLWSSTLLVEVRLADGTLRGARAMEWSDAWRRIRPSRRHGPDGFRVRPCRRRDEEAMTISKTGRVGDNGTREVRPNEEQIRKAADMEARIYQTAQGSRSLCGVPCGLPTWLRGSPASRGTTGTCSARDSPGRSRLPAIPAAGAAPGAFSETEG